ncbi:hypothetical protein [Wolbachia endosymbiont of Aedes albopictus]|nr:hypothetical protein [Wolbachia endosymbiont of Aedes albopictus]UVW84298.1 hypothetical protein NHG98_02195 [Wolbachia endosymbiont of Aedes albopictus]
MNRGMTVRGGMTVKQFVIPQLDLEIPRRYDVGLLSCQCVNLYLYDVRH